MAFNVTISVAPGLRSAVDGRRELSLGLPDGADVGDLIHTLLKLYPRLTSLLASDGRVPPRTLQFFLSPRGTLDLSRRGSGLHEGERLLLAFAGSAPRDEVVASKG